jgi:thymidylate synthase ThyX
MTELKADVFCLTDGAGRLLPPAVQATVLAKYSRSPLSAREIVSSLTPEEADRFQEKWVLQFSHSSVAELANIPICFEGVSIVASKFLESLQRPGYSEKSTRYQSFSSESFVTPPGAPRTMKEFASRLYGTYEALLPRVTAHIAAKTGKSPEDRTVKARAFDNVRYLLPAGTGTNLAWVGNARDARYLINSALGSSNPEIQAIGEAARAAVGEFCPVFVKDSEPDSYEPKVKSLGSVSQKFNPSAPDWYVDVHNRHLLPDADKVVATFEATVADRHGMSWTAFSKHMESRGKRAVPRIFRTVRMAFDVMMDYGAYRDLQRHRRCEQYSEPLTPDYGFLIPDDIAGTDMEGEYVAAMSSVAHYADEKVVHDSDLLQYVVPLGFLHRTVFDMDLAEVYYVSELRTQPQGHISYRRVGYEMFAAAKSVYGPLMAWCRAMRPDEIGEHR